MEIQTNSKFESETEIIDPVDKDFYKILKQNIILNVRCFKWLHKYNNRKYDEMFDFDTDQFKLSEYNVNEGGTIIDNFKVLKFLDNTFIDKNENDTLDVLVDSEKNEKIIQKNEIISSHHFLQNREFLKNNIVIESNFKHDFSKQFLIKYNKYSYVVSKYLKEDSHLLNLNIGSFLRIGKYFLKVLVLKIENELKYKKSIHNNVKVDSSTKYFNQEEEPSCRFCFKEKSKNNNLISVCDCRGTLKYIHTKCLSKWLKSKCDFQYEFINPNFFKIKIKKFYCEICKKTFPLLIRDPDNQEEFVYLLNILETKNNYMVLKNVLVEDEKTIEHFKFEKEEKKEFVEYLYVELNNYYKKTIVIGRDKSCDVILDDISVSRKHCMIYIDKEKNNVLKIKDMGSKFGTLINMQEDIVIDELHPNLTLQKGNTVYHFKLKNLFM